MTSLYDQLCALRDRVNLKPEVSGPMHRHVEELRRKLYEIGAVGFGDHFPGFELLDHHGVTVRSEELLAQGPLVIVLFRGTWCTFCDFELRFLNQIYGGIRSLGAELVAISPQSPASARDYLAGHQVRFPVLVDPNARFAMILGLGYGFPEYLEELYRNVFKIDLAKINEGGLWRLPIAGRFVVNQSGVVADARYDPDYRYRPEPADILSTLGALRESVSFG